MKKLVLCAALLALAGCGNARLDTYEDAARRVRRVCEENGNPVGSPAFNDCFNTIWTSSLAAESNRQRAAAPWPFPATVTCRKMAPGSVQCG